MTAQFEVTMQLATLAILLVGVVFGIYPAYRAATLLPTQGMR